MARENAKRKAERVRDPKGEKGEPIVIDAAKGLVFENEELLYRHFGAEIRTLEDGFFKLRAETDIGLDDFPEYEELLGLVLEDPDEIWENSSLIPNQVVYTYVGRFEIDDLDVYYAAVTYVSEDKPSFVFLHFPTNDLKVIEHYRSGQVVYDRVIKDVENGAIEGDALSEGDELAVGLYKSMLTLRSERDIPEVEFHTYVHLREESIEEADEIWRNNDLRGNTLVSFIKEVADADTPDLFYIVVTVEDTPSGSHALLFSFPTRDRTLVDRYRHGENLQAEEVVQEASH
jgi:hypothetical protein